MAAKLGLIVVFLSATVPAIAQVITASCGITGGTTGFCGNGMSTFCGYFNENNIQIPPSANFGSCFNEDGFRCDFTILNLDTTSERPNATLCGEVYIVNDHMSPELAPGLINNDREALEAQCPSYPPVQSSLAGDEFKTSMTVVSGM
ncbi:hypothetical protein GALMADRAFT_214194 [Galerina marginata CBS 339.88]|uniref:Glycan binding protein Y3-like domain-containing protein n=1 Tax=Galerina marginata (strain CBS 339.88) TaxID=685588 RepID=A0A067SSX9_GALM3|nr:hypothetical protein GALMADRAFT_214194 [Galerina marginata CBS 339.88]